MLATGKDKDRALSTSSIDDAINHGFLDQITRTFHGPAIIRRSPATAVDGSILISVVQRSGFIHVRDWTREYTNARHFRVICDTDSANIILDCGNLTSATSSVVIVEKNWFWKVDMIIEVIRVFRILENDGKVR